MATCLCRASDAWHRFSKEIAGEIPFGVRSMRYLERPEDYPAAYICAPAAAAVAAEARKIDALPGLLEFRRR